MPLLFFPGRSTIDESLEYQGVSAPGMQLQLQCFSPEHVAKPRVVSEQTWNPEDDLNGGDPCFFLVVGSDQGFERPAFPCGNSALVMTGSLCLS